MSETEAKETEKEEKLQKGQKDDDNNTGNKIIIGVLSVVIIVMAVVLVSMMNKNKAEEEKEPLRNVVVTPENAEEVAQQLFAEETSPVQAGYYTVSMATNWHFEKADQPSYDARVDNVADNTNDIYFDVFLVDDESEPIYQSPIIPRGGFIEHIALDKKLEAGAYDCVIVYHLIDEEQNTLSTLRVSFLIFIEE